MGKRIADSERIERIREWARQSSARRRVKLSMDGKMQLLCWIPATLRAQLDATAAQRNQNLSEVTTALLSAALAPSAPAPVAAPSPTVDTLPLFDTAAHITVTSERDSDRDTRIRALKREQPELSNYAIADQVGCSEPTVRRALKKSTQEAAE